MIVKGSIQKKKSISSSLPEYGYNKLVGHPEICPKFKMAAIIQNDCYTVIWNFSDQIKTSSCSCEDKDSKNV